MDYKIFWSEEAIKNLDSILDYLIDKWSDREVSNFKKKLSKQIELIITNPFMFPVSEYQPNLRKAVLSRQTTMFYEVKGHDIKLAYLFVNKMNINKIK